MYSAIVKDFDIKNNYLRTIAVTKNLKIMSYLKSMRLVNIML
ncbi:hypothetical protein RPATATE_1005 [Rickettsia parkeri str. Tate's Hell]|uniref:Uncharacterized protein n=1 Tax=Rickettsia parkeri str. Tate's Hell TaxID=1359189 RepID=A0ABR5DP16_RICPA|nr:hypothetical protein RPAAT24_1518 [Rickettsia parkeri str. AT\